MYVLFDTVTRQDIPSLANTSRDAVAGYADGLFKNDQQVFAQDPRAHHLSIAVRPQDVADVLDIETGDAQVADAPDWWHDATLAGIWRPCLYIELSRAGELYDEMRGHGIHRTSYRLWTAHYTGSPHVEPGSDATQWTSHALGRNLDESLCLDTFFQTHPAAKRQQLHREDVATLEFEPATGHWAVIPRPAREV